VRAREETAQARALFESLGQPYNAARAAFYQGNVEYSAGELTEAAPRFDEAAGLLTAAGNQVMAATALMNVGVVNYYGGRPSEALRFLERSADAFRSLGDERRAAEVDVNASTLRLDFNLDADAARRTVANAKQNLERLGFTDFQLGAIQAEGDDYRYRGMLDRGRMVLSSAVAMARDKGLGRRVTSLTVALAQNDAQAGRYAAAYAELQPLTSGPDADSEARIAAGTVLTAIGDYSAAEDQLRKARTDVDASGYEWLLPAVDAALGHLYADQGRLSEARNHFNAAIEAWHDPLPHPSVVESRCARARLDGMQAEQRTRAARELDAALGDAKRVGRVAIDAICRLDLAELELIDGDAARALSTLAGIPDDTPAQSLGRDLRARVEFARGRAMLATRSAGAADRLATAQRLMTEISKELPADIRQRFEARGEVRAMLAGDERSGSPAH
jgi:tetratricopeptide (TPR) repeat protein